MVFPSQALDFASQALIGHFEAVFAGQPPHEPQHWGWALAGAAKTKASTSPKEIIVITSIDNFFACFILSLLVEPVVFDAFTCNFR
jgi:hypothetical protein